MCTYITYTCALTGAQDSELPDRLQAEGIMSAAHVAMEEYTQPSTENTDSKSIALIYIVYIEREEIPMKDMIIEKTPGTSFMHDVDLYIYIYT